jgi:hypothetical protein
MVLEGGKSKTVVSAFDKSILASSLHDGKQRVKGDKCYVKPL